MWYFYEISIYGADDITTRDTGIVYGTDIVEVTKIILNDYGKDNLDIIKLKATYIDSLTLSKEEIETIFKENENDKELI